MTPLLILLLLSCVLAVPAFAGEDPTAARPDVYLLSPQALVRSRERARAGDADLQPAVDRLRADAEKALKAGPFSVMDKKSVPPSGDKHDYMSVGPYWWPDPTKPDGLPYIRRDGQVNPERGAGDTDANALSAMVSAVDTLSLAYYLTGEERYGAHAAKLLRAWFLDSATRMNPNLNFGQAIPGRVTGRGIGLIDTRGFATMLDSVALLEGAPGWTAADRAGLVSWFSAFLEWMRASPIGKEEDKEHNNHGTYYDIQVVRYALFAGKPDVARDVLERSRTRRLATQIEPDGKQPHELARTKAFSYSQMNLAGFFDLAAMGERVGVDLWRWESADGRSIRKALDFLAPYADTTREWPYPQIETKGVGYRLVLAPLLHRAAILYNDTRYTDALARLPADGVRTMRYRLTY